MRHTIPFLIAVLAALPSCIREVPVDTDPTQGTLKLAISAGIPVRAQADAEFFFNNVRVFVFDYASGKIERTLDLGQGATDATMGVKAGMKAIFAYANHSVSPAQGATLDSQPITGNATLVDNAFASSCFAMRGHMTVNIIAGEVHQDILYMERCASRIVIKSIENRLPNGIQLTILGAYLADAYLADTPWQVLPDGQYWANKWGRTASLQAPVSTVGLPINTAWLDDCLPHTITNGTNWNVPISNSQKGPRLYCMPNTADQDGGKWESGAQWSPRTTKLVLLARVGSGNVFYYPIPLPDLDTNESRELAIHIYGIGTDDPEELAGTATCEAACSVLPYEPGATYTDNSNP